MAMTKLQYAQAEANKLINELIHDPSLFWEKRKTHRLLQQFFGGLPLAHLHELLAVRNDTVLKVAFSITSELADGVVDEFLDEAIAYHNHPDRWIRHCADAVIAKATNPYRRKEFFHVLEHLEDKDQSVMGDALFLFVNAVIPQLEGALSHFETITTQSAAIHTVALHKAIEKPSMDLEPIKTMIQSGRRLETLYGIGIAIRNRTEVAQSTSILRFVDDADLSRKAQAILRMCRPRA